MSARRAIVFGRRKGHGFHQRKKKQIEGLPGRLILDRHLNGPADRAGAPLKLLCSPRPDLGGRRAEGMLGRVRRTAKVSLVWLGRGCSTAGWHAALQTRGGPGPPRSGVARSGLRPRHFALVGGGFRAAQGSCFVGRSGMVRPAASPFGGRVGGRRENERMATEKGRVWCEG